MHFSCWYWCCVVSCSSSRSGSTSSSWCSSVKVLWRYGVASRCLIRAHRQSARRASDAPTLRPPSAPRPSPTHAQTHLAADSEDVGRRRLGELRQRCEDRLVRFVLVLVRLRLHHRNPPIRPPRDPAHVTFPQHHTPAETTPLVHECKISSARPTNVLLIRQTRTAVLAIAIPIATPSYSGTSHRAMASAAKNFSSLLAVFFSAICISRRSPPSEMILSIYLPTRPRNLTICKRELSTHQPFPAFHLSSACSSTPAL